MAYGGDSPKALLGRVTGWRRQGYVQSPEAGSGPGGQTPVPVSTLRPSLFPGEGAVAKRQLKRPQPQSRTGHPAPLVSSESTGVLHMERAENTLLAGHMSGGARAQGGSVLESSEGRREGGFEAGGVAGLWMRGRTVWSAGFDVRHIEM